MNQSTRRHNDGKARLFIGIPIEDKYCDLIEDNLSELDSGEWNIVSPDNLHLTVLYIGAVDENLIPYIEEIIENICDRTKPISFMGARAIIMRPDEPTMLWIKYDRSKYFESLVADCEKYFKKIGTWEAKRQKAYNKNNNQPLPHITIGRINGGGMLDSLLPPIELSPRLDSFTARKIVLYRSNKDQITGNMNYARLKEWGV
jgi:2'-5' RNA ligase